MKYAARKLITLIVTLFAISLVVFLAFRLIPGDPALTILGGQSDPAKIEALREKMGLNDPLLVQYGRWALGLLHGDLGTSYKYGVTVSSLLSDKILITVFLTIEAFILMTAISIPLGIYTAKHANGWIDRFIVILDQIIMAVPPFFSGILITYIFGITLRVFVPGGYISWQTSFGGFLGYLFFPALAISLPKSAMIIKLLRGTILTESKKDYVRTAYSRGSTTNYVLYRHVLKNAVSPIVTFCGLALSDMIAGSIIIEQVFGIPGLGKLLVTSIGNRDYPVIEAIIIVIALIVVLSNVIVDLINQKIDPRIELE